MIINKENKQISMDFEKIRKGTVFTFDGKTYFKCEGDGAVDLVTGDLIHPANWDPCFIHPKASLKLG